MHALTLQLTDREMEVVKDRADKCGMTPEQVALLWLRYGQSVEAAANGRKLFAGTEELFPNGACGPVE